MAKEYITTCRRVTDLSDDLCNSIANLNHNIVSEYAPSFLAKLPVIVAIPCWLTFTILWIGIAGPLTLIVYAVLWLVNAILAPFTTVLQPSSLLAATLAAIWLFLLFIALRFNGCVSMLGSILKHQASTA